MHNRRRGCCVTTLPCDRVVSKVWSNAPPHERSVPMLSWCGFIIRTMATNVRHLGCERSKWTTCYQVDHKARSRHADAPRLFACRYSAGYRQTSMQTFGTMILSSRAPIGQGRFLVKWIGLSHWVPYLALESINIDKQEGCDLVDD